LSLNGENDDAIGLLNEALQLNPHLGERLGSVYVIAYFNSRRYAEAVAAFERLESPRTEHMRWAAAAYSYLDRGAEAARAVARYLQTYPNFDPALHLARIPFTRPEDLTHYGEGLRRAGLVGAALSVA
ncbi:MAG: hypothetical protein ACREXT_05725, partial [Gammaproteobacteria bacterium]